MTVGQVITALVVQNPILNPDAAATWYLRIHGVEIWGGMPTATAASAIHVVWNWLGPIPLGTVTGSVPQSHSIDIGNVTTRAHLSRHYSKEVQAPGIARVAQASGNVVFQYECPVGDGLMYVHGNLAYDTAFSIIPPAGLSMGIDQYRQNQKRAIEDLNVVNSVAKIKARTVPVLNE